MSDSLSGMTNGSDGGGQQQELRVQILGQYVKDLSFENPGAPTNMGNRPQIEMGVDLQSRGVDQDRYEVNLKLRITAKAEDRPMFLLELQYAGLFSIVNAPPEIIQQFTLSALDGAACKLGVSRETLARALATEKSREEFAKKYHVNDAELAKAIRAGLLRAISDAEEAGALPGPLGYAARRAIESIPLDQAIELVHNAGSIFGGGGSIVGLGEEGLGLLEEFIP